MANKEQKDNSTFRQKVLLRQKARELIDSPVVMETHGGNGQLFAACYLGLADGIVFEKDPKKAAVLGRQRSAWAVYEADCLQALKDGVGGHLLVNLLDVDPYGDPWPVIEAFFTSKRPRAERLVVVVNDGLRQSAKMGLSWNIETLRPMVVKYGNDLYPIYLDVCRELMTEKAALAGYRLDRFTGYYCGYAKQMTHYLAVLINDVGESGGDCDSPPAEMVAGRS